MTKEKWYSIIRHALTFVGGLLVLKGTIDESVSEQVIASIMTLVGLVWGQVEKK
jgi:hypothetical protein